MASQTLCYTTILPNDIINIIERDLGQQYDKTVGNSRVGIGEGGIDSIRHSQNSWIPSHHWVNGFIMHYVNIANRTNFLYDLTGIDGETVQYTVYNEGCYYGWHTDQDYESYYKPITKTNRDGGEVLVHDYLNKNTEVVRKLSFSLLLSDPDEYEGGNFQMMNGGKKSYFVPRKKGIISVFDSRTPHRVLKVTKGTRKSIVGWCVGPRWK
jgi:PKHD-type hydroxylase